MLSKLKKKKSRTNEVEIRQKTASLNSKFAGSKNEEGTSTCSLLKNFETQGYC